MNDLSRTKQIIYVCLGLIALGAIGYGAYYYLYSLTERNPVGNGGSSGGSGSVSGLPDTSGNRPDTGGGGDIVVDNNAGVPPEERKLLQLTDFPVIAPALDKTESRIMYYRKDGGELTSSNFTGQDMQKLSSLTILGVINAVWSPARDNSLIQYLDGETLKTFIHSGTSSAAVLPQDAWSIAWSPDGKSIAYDLSKSDSMASLFISNSSGKNAKETFTHPLLDASITWITSDKIAFTTAPSGLAEGYVFTYSRAANALNKILGPQNGIQTLWSPAGTKFLASVTNKAGKNIALSIYDPAGKELFQTGLPALSEKCAWAGEITVFCAVPRSIPENLILPDDYLRGEFLTEDRVLFIDLDKKEASEIFNERNFDMSGLTATKDGSYLFFIDRHDGTLWRIKLK